MVVHLIYGSAYIPHMSMQLIGMCLYRSVHLIQGYNSHPCITPHIWAHTTSHMGMHLTYRRASYIHACTSYNMRYMLMCGMHAHT